MKRKLSSKFRQIHKKWFFWLLIVTGIAIILRSLPAWTNAAWGNDFGIYYGLTNSFIESGELFNKYTGWGNSYQYFPVLYAFTGFIHWITGIKTITLLTKLAPIFGGLSILVFYFVVHELTKNKKIALISSLFLAVMPLHVYQTSHAYPLTMGHFFLMLSIYLFIKYRQNIKYLVPLFISTGLLIMSHHLTTYMYLISLVFIILIENNNIDKWKESIKKDISYFSLTSGLIFSYWMFVATPVYESFMKEELQIIGLYLSPNHMIMLFYILFFSMITLLHIKKKYKLSLNINIPEIKPHFISISIFSLCLSTMVFFNFVKLPGTNFSFTPLSILYALPILAVFGLGAAGFNCIDKIKNGLFIKGWTIALVISFIYGVIAKSSVLPHRHFEYLMAPLSVLSVYGIKNILDSKHKKFKTKKQQQKLHSLWLSFIKNKKFNVKQFVYIIIIILVVGTNAASVYSFHSSMNVTYEGISDEDLAVVDWMEENLDKNNTVVVSDHRISRIMESSGFNTTMDQAYLILIAENLSSYKDELYGVNKNYSRITHVVIDDKIREKVVNPTFKKAFYMDNKSYNKFSPPLYNLLYRNETINTKTKEATSWCEIYKVNWSYLEEKKIK